MAKLDSQKAPSKLGRHSAPAALEYMSGFGNHFETEAIANALPKGQNSPQKVPLGLYAEQLSGTAFSALRHENHRDWLYRIRPSVLHGKFEPIDNKHLCTRPFYAVQATPNQLRWDALPIPMTPTDFLDGLVTVAGNGDPASVRGCAVHVYAANQSMTDRYFFNTDGDFLFVPELGSMRIHTELGVMEIAPGEIAVVQRGIKYRVELLEESARGYVLENYGPPLRLPHLGVIGANGLANPRHFLTPVAAFEKLEGNFKLVNKYHGQLFQANIGHSPLDVVAWHGNYAPYKYDLKLFNTINTVSFDHPDPSIFTVLTSPSELPGTANVDFVIFPPRWTVAENTFRPPYYHRNVMSEYMGLVFGVYDAKAEGFLPGGGSLHNALSAHGPDAATFDRASNGELKPQYIADTLAFMFESSLVFHPTEFALKTEALQMNYLDCWAELKANFKPNASE